MSQQHKSFFGKIFGNAWDFIKAAFDKADGKLLETVITVTNTIKGLADSPLADIITAITPTTLDDKAVAMLRAKLPSILAAELLIKACDEDSTAEDIAAVGIQITKAFGILSDERKAKFYTTIAAEIFIFLNLHKNGEKVTFGQAATFVETAYMAYLNSKN